MSDHEILTGTNAVWVNDATGHCIGRFGRLGIDVHHPADLALAEPSQCLACTHGPTGEGEWQRFRALMREHHRVAVPDDARPGFLGHPGADGDGAAGAIRRACHG